MKLRRKSLLGLSAAGLMCWGIFEYGDEVLNATSSELALEEKIGTQIYLPWTSTDEERNERIMLFEGLYNEAQREWDYFDQQFAEVGSISIADSDENFTASESSLLGRLEINSSPGKFPRDDELIHELAHCWYSSLPTAKKDELMKAWEVLSGKNYHGCTTMEDEECKKKPSCDWFIERAATASCYGAHSLDEDVAEIARLVYDLNKYGRMFLIGKDGKMTAYPLPSSIFYITPKTLPRVEQKIEMLAKYQFYSEEEKIYALGLLKEKIR